MFVLALVVATALAQESRFEVGAGFGVEQPASDANPRGHSIGMSDLRLNPNGASLRLLLEAQPWMDEGTLARPLAIQAGVAARQPGVAVAGGIEAGVIESQSEARDLVSGFWFDVYFGCPRWLLGGAPLSFDIAWSVTGGPPGAAIYQSGRSAFMHRVADGVALAFWFDSLSNLSEPETTTFRYAFGLRSYFGPTVAPRKEPRSGEADTTPP